MTNAEKKQKEIIVQECKTGDWAVNKYTGEIMDCDYNCNNCLFGTDDCSCKDSKINWLNAEYKEPKEFTNEEKKANPNPCKNNAEPELTNADVYAMEIVTKCDNDRWGIGRKTMQIKCCDDLVCEQCYLFQNNYTENQGECWENARHWLVQPYKPLNPKKEFTDEERELIRLIDKAEWAARNKDGNILCFTEKPLRSIAGHWYASTREVLVINFVTSLPFAAIKATDTEPTSRAEILGGGE